jgi:adenylate kinase family enzyme
LKTLVIWFLGSNGSGKTTQSRKIHSYFGNEEKQIHKDKNGYSYTITSGEIGHVGKFSNNQCCGTDTIQKKEDIQKCFEELLSKNLTIITLDGIMATGTWPEFLMSDKTILLPILLNVSESLNFDRVMQRRFNKKGVMEELDDKTKENLKRKIKSFQSIYSRCPSKHKLKIECEGKNEDEIFVEILNFISGGFS